MAKNSQVLRDQKRDKLIAKYAARRGELRDKLKDPNIDLEDKLAISAQLTKLPLNSCPTRKTRRCADGPLQGGLPQVRPEPEHAPRARPQG